MIKGFNEDKKSIGAIYEKLTDKNTRKSKGIYYTPDYIVDYILKYTVLEADIVSNPFIKILDPTCGGGYFLVKSYDILREKFISSLSALQKKYGNHVYYMENKKSTCADMQEIRGREYWIEENIDYHIIKNCLYGMDLDIVAVQLAKRNLLNRCQSKVEIDMNIVQGDSLIRWEKINLNNEASIVKSIIYEDYKDENRREQYLTTNKIDRTIDNLRKFWSNKFDYIIGNPPYIVLLQSKIEKDYWNYIINNYKTIGYKKNTFYLLMERVIDVLKYGGRHSFIVPDRYFLANSYEESRKSLFKNSKIINITGFSNKVFEDAIVDSVVYIIEKGSCEKDYSIPIKLDYIDDKNFYSSSINPKDINKNNKFAVNILTKNECQGLIKKVKDNSKILRDFSSVHVGMMIKDKSHHFEDQPYDNKRDRVVVGRDLDKYIIDNEDRYFNANRVEIFGGTKNVEKHKYYPKILLRKTGDNIVAAIDEYGLFAEQSVYLIIPYENCNIFNLLGQIQSEVCNFYFKEALITNPKAYPYIQHYDAERLPINLELMYDKQYGELIKKIIGAKNEIKNLKFNLITENKDYHKIMYHYDQFKEHQLNFKKKLKECIIESNSILYEAYRFTQKDIVLICDKLSKNHKDADDVLQYNKVFQLNKDSYTYYNELLDELFNVLKSQTIKLLKENKRYLSVEEIEEGIKDRIENFYDIITIIKKYRYQNSNSCIVKEMLNTYSDTWNKYMRSRKTAINKKDLVKYSRHEYGLASWEEDIHETWFENNGKTP
ncbi:Eco57I restriction-modification methylase domain-containing protein [Clostridium sp. OS1-26]|uniref:Eco57I restriction-modification methylase domain-containing protein n=1 Tax=Clostridium sp. OS1-26 TaxID=3070681 RepID=UPI0027DF1B7D|nr:TaqI-like C-terminal specificity domain-containing protein [Clostridium sp. OS1-26]WML35593.1 TaqI-like C-terminal specificity domain-containing protein [Clostridium sp. OS1-26]